MSDDITTKLGALRERLAEAQARARLGHGPQAARLLDEVAVSAAMIAHEMRQQERTRGVA